jgi:hypothetical protein
MEGRPAASVAKQSLGVIDLVGGRINPPQTQPARTEPEGVFISGVFQNMIEEAGSSRHCP